LAQVMYQGTGRRKTAIARVRIIPGGGQININGHEAEQYFAKPTLLVMLKQPLEITGTLGRFDVVALVEGGGITGQAGAVRLGIARALLKVEPELRPSLKKAGFLTRDPRMKERRKYGLKKARKAPQFSKR
jgi:small subunit ribosomal protein S9